MNLNKTLPLVSSALLLGVAAPVLASTTIPLETRRTYLHTSPADPSLDAIPIDLASLGIAAGDRVQVRRLGDFDNGPGTDAFTGMVGVFSAGTALLPRTQLHRVPGALKAGANINTGTTHVNGEPTDIPEDFLISNFQGMPFAVCVIVPNGATHLFVAALDSHYSDNGDSNADFGVEITLLDICAADLTGDGAVAGADLAALLGNWGPKFYSGAPGDIDCDGDVDASDLSMLLASWGPCGGR